MTIIGNKKYLLLKAEHNGVDIFSGDHKDQYSNTGVSGYTYFTGEAAMREAQKQGKKLFDNKEEVDAFIDSLLPLREQKREIQYFIYTLGLKEAGYWHPDYEKWNNVGSYGCAILSRVEMEGDEYVYGVQWNDEFLARIERGLNHRFPAPVIVSENC